MWWVYYVFFIYYFRRLKTCASQCILRVDRRPPVTRRPSPRGSTSPTSPSATESTTWSCLVNSGAWRMQRSSTRAPNVLDSSPWPGSRTRMWQLARLRLHGTIVEGRIIEVNLATPKNSISKSMPSRSLFPLFPQSVPLPSSQVSKRFVRATPRTLMEAKAKFAEAQRNLIQLRRQSMVDECFNIHNGDSLGAKGDSFNQMRF